MISLELARRFKEAGLTWNVTLYDFCYYQERLCAILFAFTDKAIISPGFRVNTSECVFCPRLDQLLAEGDKRGYRISVIPLDKTRWFSVVSRWSEEMQVLDAVKATNDFDAPEDAAAQALIWILEREKGANQDD